MSTQSEALKERTMLFAISVLHLIDKFHDTPGTRVIAYQLAKCSTSVGANYRAVCNARSRAEFIAKLGRWSRKQTRARSSRDRLAPRERTRAPNARSAVGDECPKMPH